MSLAQALATAADITADIDREEAAWRMGCEYLGMRAYPWHEWELWMAPGLHVSRQRRRSTCQHVWRAEAWAEVERDALDVVKYDRLCAAVGDTFVQYEYCGHGCGTIGLRGQQGQYGICWQESVNPLSGNRRILYWLVEPQA